MGSGRPPWAAGESGITAKALVQIRKTLGLVLTNPPTLKFENNDKYICTCKYLLGGRVTLGERAFGQIFTLSDHPPLFRLNSIS